MHNFIASGFPSPAEDYLKPNLDLNAHLILRPAATFFMKAEGNESPKHGIFHNDILIVDKAESLSANRIVIANIDGEFLIVPYHLLKQKEVEIWGGNYCCDPSPIADNRTKQFLNHYDPNQNRKEIFGRTKRRIHHN